MKKMYLVHVVFAEPLYLDDYAAIIQEIPNAWPGVVGVNTLGNPLADNPGPDPCGVLIVQVAGATREMVETHVRTAAADHKLRELRLTEIRRRQQGAPGD